MINDILDLSKKEPWKTAVAGLAGKQALIVDDNQLSLDLLTSALKFADLKVVDLKNGLEVLGTLERAILSGNPFDCCIVNIHLPGMDGYTIAEKIRSSNTSLVSKLPLIAISTMIEREPALLAKAGYNQSITKPLQREKLYQVLEEVLKGDKKASAKQMTTKAAEITTIDGVRSHQPHILVAEDNGINQELMKILLKKLNYDVTIVSNGQEAVDAFLESPHNFDLILMDLRMPELDGFGALKAIRKKGFSIPVIALTAHASKENRDKCLAAGMDDFLAKPIRKEALMATLIKYLKTAPSVV